MWYLNWKNSPKVFAGREKISAYCKKFYSLENPTFIKNEYHSSCEGKGNAFGDFKKNMAIASSFQKWVYSYSWDEF